MWLYILVVLLFMIDNVSASGGSNCHQCEPQTGNTDYSFWEYEWQDEEFTEAEMVELCNNRDGGRIACQSIANDRICNNVYGCRYRQLVRCLERCTAAVADCHDNQHFVVATGRYNQNYCADDTVTSCSKGFKFSDGGGNNDGSCTACPSGTYQPNDASTATSCITQSTCPTGTYRSGDATADATCHDCAAGFFQDDDSHSQASCKECAAGSYQDQNGASGCNICAEGTYSSSGSALCSTCSDGNQAQSTLTIDIDAYVTDSATYCVTCENGYDNTDGNQCDACQNSQVSKNGAICSTCPVGQQSQRVTDFGINNYVASIASECVTCENGYDNTDGDQCEACTNGQVSKNGVTCYTCPAGQQGQRVTDIGINNYVASTAFECVTCENGYDNTDGEQCEACTNGQVSKNGATCSTCPSGQQGQQVTDIGIDNYVAIRASECVTCPDGYDNVDGQQQCQICAAGDFSSNGAPCASCPSGSMTDTLSAEGGSTCTQCATGEYSAVSTQECQLCPAGSVTNTLTGLGASTCTQCPPGKWTANSWEACKEWTICPAGFYLAGHTQNNDGVCTQCEDGTYCPGGSSYSSIDMGYPGVQLYCAPKFEGIDNVDLRTSHENSCVICDTGFVGDTYVSQSTSDLGDKSMSSQQCEDYATGVGVSFSEVFLSNRPWGCYGHNGEIHYNNKQFNTGILCSEEIPCYKNVADEGTADCSECAQGTYVNNGVCIPWTYANQSECEVSRDFIAGSVLQDSYCILESSFILDEPSDRTFDLTVESILCGEQYAQLDKDGNVVCKDCHRQEFLDIYGGNIETTDDTLKRGSCCSNSHHHVCIQMMDEYQKKCGTPMTRGSNQCV